MDTLKQNISGILSKAETVSFPNRTTAEDMVRQVLADEEKRKRSRKLTWSGRGVAPASPTDLVGLWNKRMPYIKTAEWVVQNRMILRINGTELPRLDDGSYDLSEIPDDLQVWEEERNGRPTGVKRKQKSVRALVSQAYEQHIREAMDRDPLLCPVNGDYRAADWDDRMSHIFHKHPEDFALRVGLPMLPKGPDAAPARETLSQEFTVGEQEPKSVGGECCGRPFTAHGLKIHQAKAHPKQAQA